MLRVGVLVSGGGTNLQAILDAMDQGKITNAEVAAVISNNPGAYALERARNHGIPAECISPKDFRTGLPLTRPWWQRWIPMTWTWWSWQASW